MRSTIHRLGATALTLATVLSIGACDEDPVSGEDDHVDPVGIVVVSGLVDVVSVRGLNIIGAFTVDEGGQTDPLGVEFIDDRGNRFVPDEPDEWLRVTVTNPALAQWVPDTPGGWTGSLRGVQAGSTTVRFELMHGVVNSEASHPDFGTPGIPLVVNN
jgi:hypothetical protein